MQTTRTRRSESIKEEIAKLSLAHGKRDQENVERDAKIAALEVELEDLIVEQDELGVRNTKKIQKLTAQVEALRARRDLKGAINRLLVQKSVELGRAKKQEAFSERVELTAEALDRIAKKERAFVKAGDALLEETETIKKIYALSVAAGDAPGAWRTPSRLFKTLVDALFRPQFPNTFERPISEDKTPITNWLSRFNVRPRRSA